VLTLALLGGCGSPEEAADWDSSGTEASLANRGEQWPLTEAAKPTFKLVKAKVLPSCAGIIACHRRAPFGGGLDLTNDNAYASLVNVPARMALNRMRVSPKDAANSFLYQKLTNDLAPADEGAPMPKTEGLGWKQISASNLSLVKKWIDAGALDN
jgi:hypothetical protein